MLRYVTAAYVYQEYLDTFFHSSFLQLYEVVVWGVYSEELNYAFI